MPSAFPVMIDTTPDLDFAAPVKAAGGERTLLLATPSVAAHEEMVRDLFTKFDRSSTDLHMVDRLLSGMIDLPANTYDRVVLLADPADKGQTNWLSRDVYGALVPAMKVGAILQAQDGALGTSDAREAILAGLVEKDGGFQKAEDEEVVVSFRPNKKKAAIGQPVQISFDNPANYENEDDDELIDEDDLLTEEDYSRPIQQRMSPPLPSQFLPLTNSAIPSLAPECQPKPGKKRRACKDCTCGLAERLEAQDKARREKADQELNTLRLKTDDLNELDFTIKGKTGSCNSCSLGDAYRCADCPYIGLPAFKPGEEVMVLQNTAQF
ncbi:uncharacterized protein E0L32_006194 [Thyridium curvatum]|uniref:Uncharacterized protein n=1 Tax=Thyridium curvatum TaxID=1093900 RepID=A0A507B415_9PEZI|nr:uncharacterized protein E0L32_006194 [Thyridium curvatum]TPX13464.1 hypothetical protein E0L32_006194 [Thyridium curvatum]